jgi:hypothetical protein
MEKKIAETMTLEEAERAYFFAADASDMLRRLVAKELRRMFDGELVVVFVDSYDLISFVFSRDLLVIDKHYAWNKALWTEVFRLIQPLDNLRITLSPPSCLEVFHILEKKALRVARGVPSITDEDAKDFKVFFSKLRKHNHAYAQTEQLIDMEKGEIRQFEIISTLIKQRKFVPADQLFSYKDVDWNNYVKIVGRLFDDYKARRYLMEQRSSYRDELRKDPATREHLTSLGLDDFTILVDTHNIAQTAYFDYISEDKTCMLSGHGVFLLTCCDSDLGTWKAERADNPVKNSMATLFLARAKRRFSQLSEAVDYFKGAQFVAEAYAKELLKTEGISEFIASKAEVRKKHRRRRVQKSRKLIGLESALREDCELVTLPAPVDEEPAHAEPEVTEEVLRFARSEEKRLERAEVVLDASRKSMPQIFKPEQQELFLPVDDRTRELLLKLQGHRLSDFMS